MMINMLQTILKNSVTEMVDLLHRHLQFIPSEEQLTSSELDVVLESPRPEDAPQLPLFIVDLILEPTNLSLDPSRIIIKQIFKQVMTLWEDALTSVNSLVGDQLYQDFTK